MIKTATKDTEESRQAFGSIPTHGLIVIDYKIYVEGKNLKGLQNLAYSTSHSTHRFKSIILQFGGSREAL